ARLRHCRNGYKIGRVPCWWACQLGTGGRSRISGHAIVGNDKIAYTALYISVFDQSFIAIASAASARCRAAVDGHGLLCPLLPLLFLTPRSTHPPNESTNGSLVHPVVKP